MNLRVIELSVGVEELVANTEHLKTLSETFLTSVPLGEGTHNDRVVDDESGVGHALRLKVISDQLVNKAGRRSGVSAFNLEGLAQVVKVLAGLFGMESFVGREGDGRINSSKFCFKSLHHGDATERRGEVNFNLFVRVSRVVSRVIFEFVRPLNAKDHLGE